MTRKHRQEIPGREMLGEFRKRYDLLVRIRDLSVKAGYPVPGLNDEITEIANKTILLNIPCMLCDHTVQYAVRVIGGGGNWPRAAVCATCAGGGDPSDLEDMVI